MKKFLIKLKHLHDKSGMTAYAVGKATGIHENTVRMFVSEDVVRQSVSIQVVKLAEFYGADWQDPDVVEVVEVENEDDNEGQQETLLATA
jgi:hypothetical protein